MIIHIHRGIDQIGGCITEIATENTRVLIELGQNIPSGDSFIHDTYAASGAIEKLTKGVKAIFYTHYHGDHVGHFALVPQEVPQYIGPVAKKILCCKHERLGIIPGRESVSAKELASLEEMKTYKTGHPLLIGDIQITPFMVSHSAYDAHMFLVEAGGRRILHTGDFRGHGYLSKGLIPTLNKYILKGGAIDYLISEGTMISRLGEMVQHEREIQKELQKVMKEYPYVFFWGSSTDMERLSSAYAANKAMKKRAFVCDDYQQQILDMFSDSAGTFSSLFRFSKAYTYYHSNKKLLDWMENQGFCMLIRPTQKFHSWLDSLLANLDSEKTVLIYSQWKGYIEEGSPHASPAYLELISRFPRSRMIHTSGHASPQTLADLCTIVNPSQRIIPIHSLRSEDFSQLNIHHELKSRIITSNTDSKGDQVNIDR